MRAKADIEQVQNSLRTLPPERLAQVADFIALLEARDTDARTVSSERLGEAMAKLDALDLPAMTPDEVQAEIEAVRDEARRGTDNADRRLGTSLAGRTSAPD